MGQRGIIYGTLKPPMPQGWMKKVMESKERRGSRIFFSVFGVVFILFGFLGGFVVVLVFVRLLAYFLCSFCEEDATRMRGGYWGQEGEQNWGVRYEVPKGSIKK